MGLNTQPAATPGLPVSANVVAAKRVTWWFTRHWLLAIGLLWGLYVTLPWLAPVAMKFGATGVGRVIYQVYSTQCHQLPERSYFLFGQKTMYSLAEIQAAWVPTNDPVVLRQFVGNEPMGWKVAWSDRMVSLYTSVLVGLAGYALLRNRLPRLSIWVLVLLLVPMALDGGTHMISDILGRGVGLGFRDSNAWLAALTGSVFPAGFYAGDALGSFNWWMRLLTGTLMGLGLIWFVLPYLDDSAAEARRDLTRQLARVSEGSHGRREADSGRAR